uniref:Uncharacterized protein n=1 Tax=Chrysemys picta bellii TaxID=8478 RepID=A0A8C3HJZ4_CHRPI
VQSIFSVSTESLILCHLLQWEQDQSLSEVGGGEYNYINHEKLLYFSYSSPFSSLTNDTVSNVLFVFIYFTVNLTVSLQMIYLYTFKTGSKQVISLHCGSYQLQFTELVNPSSNKCVF